MQQDYGIQSLSYITYPSLNHFRIIHIAYTYDRISICIYQMYHEILFKVLKSIRQQSST